MLNLYWRGERGTKKDLYASFTTLEDFNRWSKKFLHIDFKNIISTDDNEIYKIIIINSNLSYPTKFISIVRFDHMLNSFNVLNVVSG